MAGKAYQFIRVDGVKDWAKENHKQVSPEFLNTLDRQIFEVLRRCLRNSKNKRLTAEDLVWSVL